MNVKYDVLKNIEKRAGIYKITSPSGKVYIGRSYNISKRLREHHNKSNSHIYRSIEKYGYENHKFEVIVYITSKNNDLLNMLEILFISLYRSTNIKIGLNITSGGGRLDFKHSPSTIEKMKINRVGWQHSIGRILSDETKNKISKSLIGNVVSGLCKYNIRKAGLNNGKNKLYLDTFTGVYYYSERECCNYSIYKSRALFKKHLSIDNRYICC